MKNSILAVLLMAGFAATGQIDNRLNYSLNTSESIINWRGYYTFQFSDHTGTVNFSSGELYTTDGMIVGGTFTIDMTSMTNEDYLKGDGPVQHLKDPDFFHVSKFPKATLTITDVEYFADRNIHKFTADLTIKGITKSQEFWGTAHEDKKQITTAFKIDRTRWGIVYNSDLKDHAISDAIEFDVLLQFQ